MAIWLLAGVSAAATLNPSKPVATRTGLVTGTLSGDRQVAVYRGIPFAAPPVGPLRWRPPQPARKWKGVLKADHFSQNCVQPLVHNLLPWTPEFMLRNGVSEDCLYLNIWASSRPHAQPLPVYVYIYGGAFTGGAGDVSIYNGEHLARRGIIVITFNYRVGVLGFLADQELTRESPHHSSGNYGLLDQLAALRWVQQNIAAFGGDPKRVTVGGQSAGAISVSLLVASPLAKGLFRGAVAESGSGIAGIPLKTLAQGEKTGEQFVHSKGVHSLAELRKMSWQKLTAEPPKGMRFGPIVDGWFAPRTPVEAFEHGKQNDVPTITGWNRDDHFGKTANAGAFHKRVRNRYGSLAAEFLKLYPANSSKQASRDRNRVSMYLWAQARARTAKTPAYTYFFTRAIPWPQHPEFGAFHTGEVPYIFDNLYRLPRPWQPVDHKVARIFSSFLIDFVKTGDPNAAGLPHWPAYDPAAKATMEIGAQCKPIPLASPAREQFWVKYFHSPQSKNAPFL
ncbi:MAG TPA: carboxylesterase family protein [Bryobacteraceae bacterium]